MTKDKDKEREVDEKAQQLVQNEVYCVISWLMDDLLRYAEEHPRESAIDIDDYWSKLNVCPECGSRNYEDFDFDEHKEENPDFDIDKYNEDHWNYQVEEDSNYDYICEDCGTIFNEPATAEVYEYWFVSDWFAKKLEAKGEIVLDTWVPIWCRCATGQAIYMDGVIQRIAKEILDEYKKYETKEK